MGRTTEIQEQIIRSVEADPVASDVQVRIVRVHDQLAAALDDVHRHLLDDLVEALGEYRDRVELHAYEVGVAAGEATATSLRATVVELRAVTLRLEHVATRLEGGS